MHYCKNSVDGFISKIIQCPWIPLLTRVQTCAALNLLQVSRSVCQTALNSGLRACEAAVAGSVGVLRVLSVCVCAWVRGWLGGYLLTECLSLPAHLTERRWSPSRRPCRSSWMRQTREPRSSRPRWDAAATWPTISSVLLPSNQPCHLSHASPQRSGAHYSASAAFATVIETLGQTKRRWQQEDEGKIKERGEKKTTVL